MREVAQQGRPACVVVEENERGEMRQLDSFVIDEGRLDTAVGQGDPVRQLRQCVPIAGHGPSMLKCAELLTCAELWMWVSSLAIRAVTALSHR